MKKKNTRPELIKINFSPEAEGISPELWNELLEGMSEVVYLDTPEKVKEWLDDDEQW